MISPEETQQTQNITSTPRQSIQMHPLLFGILLAVIFCAGFFIQGKVLGYKNSSVHADTLVRAGEFNIFWEVWNKVGQLYPFDDTEPSAKERIYAATAGMVDSFGDPHTLFLAPDDTDLFNADVQGEFAGIGMELALRDNVPTVVAPLKNSPSELAGIMPGDIIYKINGEEVFNLSIDTVVGRIRGALGTPVIITIIRAGEEEPIEFSIIRDTIIIPVIETYTKGDIFVIALYSFNLHATEEFIQALKDFEKSGLKKLIIDLRSNPGGFFDASLDMASMFLPEGAVIVRERGNKDTPEKVYRSKGFGLVPADIPVVVLIDGGSASASEILAGALQEHKRAQLVGTDSFGKGSVQEFVEFNDGSSLKVTVAKWYTPNNLSISDKGLTPDHTIPRERSDRQTGRDRQLEKAIELLDQNDPA